MKENVKTMYAVVVFGIAMAALESAVVVYLRALYYTDGFTVALRLIDEKILLVELAREAATLVMLAAVGWLAGKCFKDRLAYFLLSFAVWDIFYYLWLKVFIAWPSSLLEWDILFLIPCTWLGPVLAPVVCSLTMLLLAWAILRTSNEMPFSLRVKALLGLGSMVVLYTFMKDYALVLVNNHFLGNYVHLMQNPAFIKIAGAFVPEAYSWGWFVVGELLILIAVYDIWRMKER